LNSAPLFFILRHRGPDAPHTQLHKSVGLGKHLESDQYLYITFQAKGPPGGERIRRAGRPGFVAQVLSRPSQIVLCGLAGTRRFRRWWPAPRAV